MRNGAVRSASWMVLLAVLAAACGDTDGGDDEGDAVPITEDLDRERASVANDGEGVASEGDALDQSSSTEPDTPSSGTVAATSSQDVWQYAYDERARVLIASRGDTTIVYDHQALLDMTPDEIAYASGWGVACRAACWGAAALGCAAVSVTCAVGTTITIGGTAIPCTWAIVAACTAGGAGASVCSDTLCPP